MRLSSKASAAHALAAAAAGILFGLLAVLTAASPAIGSPPLPPDGERADSVLWSENFEGTFPGSLWTVSDGNLSNGADQWSTTTYRASGGTRSAWSAAAGDRTSDAVSFTDDFETGGPLWSAEDDDANYGDDYWGLSDVQAYDGYYSFWNAQNGFNDEWGDWNTNLNMYDSYMDTTLSRPVNLTGWASATIDFWYWMDIEQGYDYFSVATYDGSWHYFHTRDGSSNGWKEDTVAIPAGTTMVGFRFTSDTNTIYPGVYVDAIQVYGQQRVLNSVSHLYDDGMSTWMTRDVDFTGFEWGRVDYQYWMETQAVGDYFTVVYYTDGWHETAMMDGVSAGWQAGSAEVPATSTGVGFRFVTDDADRAEGVYVDDVKAVGSVGALTCSAAVTPSSGIEESTPFAFVPTVGGGLRPLTWAWSFGDGGSSTAASPVRPMSLVGTFAPSVTVRDRLGQSCTAVAPELTVMHDTSVVTITPSNAEVTEGGSVTFSAFDVLGHSLDFALSVGPTGCGSVTQDGSAVVFTANAGAGGLTCTIAASMDGHVGTAAVVVLHDTSTPSISPAFATVVESETLALGAFDTFHHPLSVTWSTSCGRVDPGSGATTTFTATTSGGKSCHVTVQSGAQTAGADLAIVHDVSDLVISPSLATAREGTSVGFSIVDRYGHSIDADWTVTPSACGSNEPSTGPTTNFISQLTAGGLTCTIKGSAGGVEKSAIVNITHDWSQGTVEPLNGEVQEGGSVEFTARDANGHAVSVPWTVSPLACGAVAPLEAATTTFTASLDAGGIACVITASAGSLALRATAVVRHAPASVVQVAVGDLEAGRSTTVSATVADEHGHALNAATVAWTTDCAGVTPASGASVTLLAATTGAGSTCHVTATSGTATKTMDVKILYARPFNIKIVPSQTAPAAGAAQTVEVTVTDAVGNSMDAGQVTWSSSCGSVTGSGSKVTFTAPAGGGECALRASLAFDGAESTGQVNVAAQAGGSSSFLLIGVVAAAAAIGAVALLMMRRKRAPKQP